MAAGEKVWYGGQWGFYWYAQEAGAQISKPGEPGPLPGDLLAVGLMEGGGATLNRFPNRELVDSRSYDSPHGRTMGFGAGLYRTVSVTCPGDGIRTQRTFTNCGASTRQHRSEYANSSAILLRFGGCYAL